MVSLTFCAALFSRRGSSLLHFSVFIVCHFLCHRRHPRRRVRIVQQNMLNKLHVDFCRVRASRCAITIDNHEFLYTKHSSIPSPPMTSPSRWLTACCVYRGAWRLAKKKHNCFHPSAEHFSKLGCEKKKNCTNKSHSDLLLFIKHFQTHSLFQMEHTMKRARTR